MSIPYCIVTAWHNENQLESFRLAWNLEGYPDWLVLQQDKNKEGCAVTKNKGLDAARERDPEVIIVLDDDCYPYNGLTMEVFAQAHTEALRPQEVELFEAVTDPPSRGTPYFNRTVQMPVAASMGFWTENPDYDSPGQLIYGRDEWAPPILHKKTMFWRFFPLSGMNLAWRDKTWFDLAKFVEVPRFDDIWMGYEWQQSAYERGYCFNLNGPMVRHVRQSNVWHNLRVEAENLEKNETYWQQFVPPSG